MKDNEIPRYHSRKGAERAIDDLDRIWEIIGKAKYVTLSMVTPEGEPYCVAISHGYDREKNCLYFHTGFEGKKIDALKANPRACAFVLDDEGYVKGRCHHEYHSVICYGTITQIEGREEKLQALRTMFCCLEDTQADAEDAMRLRKLDSMPLTNVNMLKMDIDGFSGKKSSHRKY